MLEFESVRSEFSRSFAEEAAAAIDAFQSDAAKALETGDLDASRKTAGKLMRFYQGRPDLRWASTQLTERLPETFDADAVFSDLSKNRRIIFSWFSALVSSDICDVPKTDSDRCLNCSNC